MKQLLCYIFILSALTVHAQHALVPASLEQRVLNSSLIIEGVVTKLSSYKVDRVNRIFTRNEIEVTAILKGSLPDSKVQVITQGGVLENEMLICHELASLKDGQTGIFFLKESRYSKQFNSFEIYTEKQGFLKYDEESNEVFDLFRGTFKPEKLIADIQKITGVPIRRIRSVDVPVSRTAAPPQITSFSPIDLTAGTHTQLTIIGSGFGNSRGDGSVQFRNADDGGNTFIEPLESQYKSWTDTRIVVEVPTEAGTGRIRVKSGGLFFTSLQSLTIRFSRTQVEYEGISYSPLLIDQMAGGYPWRMTEKFNSDSLAKHSFLRAFNRWRCASGVNWFIGSTTAIDVTERDNLNIIRFDETEELPANVLGVCYSYYLACTKGEWYVSEFDIIFDREANWEFGPEEPGNNEFDFESVAFHELGHGHQLAHVVNQQDVMHYAIAPGTFQRTPNLDDLEGARLVMDQSTRPVCTNGAMKKITPDICDDSYFAYFESEAPGVYPVPSEGTLNISYFLSTDHDNVDISLINMKGQRVVQFINGPQKKGEHTLTEDLSVHGVRKGTYILRSFINGNEYSRKIITIN